MNHTELKIDAKTANCDILASASFTGVARACLPEQNRSMIKSFTTKAIGLCIAVLLTAAVGSAQTPLLQDIKVYNTTPTPYPKSTPLVKKTGGSSMAGVPATNNVRTMFPALAEVEIPGYSGVIVETLDGKIVLESNSGLLFNPASNVKVATTYAVVGTNAGTVIHGFVPAASAKTPIEPLPIPSPHDCAAATEAISMVARKSAAAHPIRMSGPPAAGQSK